MLQKAAILRPTASRSGSGSPPGSLCVESRPLLLGPAKPAAKEPQRTSSAAVITCVLLAITYLAAYATSLQGGSHPRDLAFINAHLNIIARCLIVAIISFTAFLWAARMLGTWAWPARAALGTAHLLLLLYNHGQDFQYHGFYNWMLCLVVGVPLTLLLLALYCWYTSMKPRHFTASFLTSGTLLAVVAAAALLHYQHMAVRGFMGHMMVPGCVGKHCPSGSEPNCNFPTTLPFIDLLPAGAQNFWTGSQRCPRIHGFRAHFTDEGLLTISRCPADAPKSYTPLPDTRRWSLEEKTREKAAYQSNVLKKLKAEPYTEPVLLEGVEAVLARCGDKERLLTRIARIAQRPPFEPQLALLRPNSTDGGGADGSKGSNDSDVGKATGKRGASQAGTDVADGGSGGGTGASGQQDRLNVLLLFIDSLGRRHFFRRMPKSAAAMEKLAASGTSSLHQFFRYHVVGFQTDPNTHAMYTGSTMEAQHAQPFWHAYRQAGYVSGSVYNLCEDWGTEYDSMLTPHDHELVAPFCLPEYHPITVDGEPYKMFKGAFSILRRCLRGRHVHEYNFDFARKFIAAYDGVAPWLLMSSFHEGHEGTGEVLGTMDASLASFLLELTPRQLSNTAVILVADHGMTMGINYMWTRNGRITEHKIPILGMLLPNWVSERYPEAAAALRANEQRLVTAFDFHATMHHLLHLGDPPLPPNQQFARWQRDGNVTEAVRWGVSLLHEVPAGRTCEEAGVPAEFCQCFPPRT